MTMVKIVHNYPGVKRCAHLNYCKFGLHGNAIFPLEYEYHTSLSCCVAFFVLLNPKVLNEQTIVYYE